MGISVIYMKANHFSLTFCHLGCLQLFMGIIVLLSNEDIPKSKLKNSVALKLEALEGGIQFSVISETFRQSTRTKFNRRFTANNEKPAEHLFHSDCRFGQFQNMHLKLIFTLQILNFNSVLLKENKKESFAENCMNIQNTIRQFYGSPPVEWDNVLADRAQALALYLSETQGKYALENRVWIHSKYGDNVYATDDPKRVDNICFLASIAWLREEYENSTRRGRFQQMLQTEGQKVGIGDAGRAGEMHFLVASYFPPEPIRKKRRRFNRRRISSGCIWEIVTKNNTKPSSRQRSNYRKLLRQFKTRNNTFFYNSTKPCHKIKKEGTRVNGEALMRDIQELESRAILENGLKKKPAGRLKHGTKSVFLNAADAKKEIQEDSKQSSNDQNVFPASGGVKTTQDHASKIILVPISEPAQPQQPQVPTSQPAKTVPSAQLINT
ncbi:uncharacterized protein LOC114535875 [Dendronephthya gigantea]|uniref:uncharacterized protein LOC114535875 n=1 Tax=Dendronephthya gigantea TaxID=151771 RepID=UPI00106D346D|nr:uncharacterized protein LOC114535875 [Dendronephthya gigantea]